jgi:GNAT superfamily N-acetyltransferase
MELRTLLRPGDIGDIIRLHGVLYAQENGWDHTFEAYVAESLSRFALHHDPSRERIWIFEHEASLQGSIGIVAAENNVAQLRWFLLTPAVRGRGYGKVLLDEAIAFCRTAGYASVFLWTVRGLDAAAQLYRRAGFTLIEDKPGFHWGAHVVEERYQLTIAAT